MGEGVKLYDHQSTLVQRLREKPRYYPAWACGSGKTIGVLAACKDRPKKTLILAPLSTLHSAWANDAEAIGEDMAIIRGDSPAKRKRLIAGSWMNACTNYDCFRSHVQDFIDAGVRRFVIDEAVKVKNGMAAITKKAIAFADRMESVIALSGYPAPQGPQDWWSQMRCVDVRCLGPSYWSFIGRYTIPIKRNVRGRMVITGFNQTDAQRAALKERLAPWVWSLTKEEYLDLPPQTDIIREVTLSDHERHAYETAKKELRIVGGSRIKAEAVLNKLQQITGGAVLDAGEPVVTGSSKESDLLDFLDDLSPVEPVIVWAEYRHEIRRLVEVLSTRGVTEALYGETSNDVDRIVSRFRDGPTQYLVAHPACAGHGTNGLQKRCSYAYFYSFGFNSDQHVQARDRIHRSGMGDRPATYVYSIAADTVNWSAFRSLRGKKSRADAITDALRACTDSQP